MQEILGDLEKSGKPDWDPGSTVLGTQWSTIPHAQIQSRLESTNNGDHLILPAGEHSCIR